MAMASFAPIEVLLNNSEVQEYEERCYQTTMKAMESE